MSKIKITSPIKTFIKFPLKSLLLSLFLTIRLFLPLKILHLLQIRMFFVYAFSVKIGTTCFLRDTTPFKRAVLFSNFIEYDFSTKSALFPKTIT